MPRYDSQPHPDQMETITVARNHLERLLTFNPKRIEEGYVALHHAKLTAKRASWRKTFPFLAFLWPTPTEADARKIFQRQQNIARHWGLTTRQEELSQATALLKGVCNSTSGDDVQVPAEEFNTLAATVARYGLDDPAPEEEIFDDFFAWKASASNHPDNGKTGWWRVNGIRHSAFARASSATEAIEKCAAAEAVDPTWEAPNAFFIGENPEVLS